MATRSTKRTPREPYDSRLAKVLKRLGAPLLLRAAPEVLRNGDVHHPYRQDSDFRWLTGFDEPEALLLAYADASGEPHRILFVRPRDPLMETWHGRRAGVRGALKDFGASEAFPVGDFWKVLAERTRDFDRLAFPLFQDPEFDRRLFAFFQKRMQGRPRRNRGQPTYIDPRPVLHEFRQIKDPTELETMREAAAITAAGHLAAMALTEPGMHEYQVQAEMEAVFAHGGSPRVGYPSIVASGNNANTLHYVENRRKMRRGDLLLIDAAAEFGHYSADVTRTFPVGGRFSEAQKAVYKIVLRCQKKCVRAVKPGCTFKRLNETARRELTKGLLELGVLEGRLDRLLAKEAYKPWYMHGIGHWLGMDVHDVGPYEDREGRSLPFRPGMVLTVEPGLYFRAGDRRVPKEFRGIGVRIEDDILVTRNGHENLTAEIPKEIREVERACA